MNDNIIFLKNSFNKTPDLIIKKIENKKDNIYIAYLESISSSDKINEYILKVINIAKINGNISKKKLPKILASPNQNEVLNKKDLLFYITNGFCLVLMDNLCLAIEARADINRGISPSQIEPSINGPKDSFTENIQINIGLIKRRIKSTNLKTESIYVGSKTNTLINILYMNDNVDLELLNEIKNKLKDINIKGIIDSSSIGYLLDKENKNVYPTFFQTERPDVVVTNLLEGKIIIMMDTSPNAIVIPSFFIDFINPTTDNYNKSFNVSFIKILRLITFFISMMFPSLYIAIMSYNQETIPTNLLINFSIQRQGVPFPIVIEALLMLGVIEILRESDLRFPSNYGSAISILGAVILGEASVNAGVVSPITIIVMAITFISSLVFNNIEINNALRFFRFIFILFTSFFGLYGLTLGLFFFIIYTTKTKSFNKPYFMPIAPFNKNYFKDTVIKEEIINDKDLKEEKI